MDVSSVYHHDRAPEVTYIPETTRGGWEFCLKLGLNERVYASYDEMLKMRDSLDSAIAEYEQAAAQAVAHCPVCVAAQANAERAGLAYRCTVHME